jgi:endonuclease III
LVRATRNAVIRRAATLVVLARVERAIDGAGTAVATLQITGLLDSLESNYGALDPVAPTDPYEFLVWWHCGYPASEERCSKGWASLTREVGIAPKRLIFASTAKLVGVLKAGGMVPDLRAARVKEIAERVQEEYGGDLRSALSRLSVPQARKALKAFPGIGNPGADRILLFSRLSPVAAVPSACPYVLVRVLQGPEGPKYVAVYAAAQQTLNTLPATVDERIRAYLLVARHGHELCKRSNPLCERCPLRAQCAFATRSKNQ